MCQSTTATRKLRLFGQDKGYAQNSVHTTETPHYCNYHYHYHYHHLNVKCTPTTVTSSTNARRSTSPYKQTNKKRRCTKRLKL